jgi:hypothetical protein
MDIHITESYISEEAKILEIITVIRDFLVAHKSRQNEELRRM